MYRGDTSQTNRQQTARKGTTADARARRPRPAPRVPLHGYELRQRLKATLGSFRAFSYGSLYPTLRRMKDAGWIAEDEGDADVVAGAPALTGRRGKVVYKLTAEGKERFAELLAEAGPSSWEDETFGVHFAFFGQTDPEVRVRILEGRRSRLEERREGARTGLARTRARLDSYTLQLQEHGLESVDREVRWLTELIETERRRRPAQASRPPVPDRPAPDSRSTRMRPRVRPNGFRPCRHRRRRQLRRVAGPGRRVLPRRRPGRPRARSDARRSSASTTSATSSSSPRSTSTPRRSVATSPRPSSPARTTPSRSPTSRRLDVTVQRGHTLDGLGKYYRETIEESDETPVDVVAALRDAQVDVLVCYLPVGSEDAAKFYAQCAIDAKVGFVNALPVFIAGTPEWAEKFRAAGRPDRR